MSAIAVTEQPAPQAGQEVVLGGVMVQLLDSGRGALGEDLVLRAQMGKERYGTYLMTHNGRNALADLYQELLDALMYLTQYGMETGDDVWREFEDVKRLAMWVKAKLGGCNE